MITIIVIGIGAISMLSLASISAQTTEATHEPARRIP